MIPNAGKKLHDCLIDDDNAACKQIISSTAFIASAVITVAAGLAWFLLQRTRQQTSSKDNCEDRNKHKSCAWLPEGHRPVCVVTGSNRGLGLQIVKSLCLDLRAHNPIVVLCSRSAENGNSAARGLKLDTSPIVRKLDITSESSVVSLAQWLQKNHGGIDILVRRQCCI